MSSKPTPHTHTANTKEEVSTEVGPSRSPVTVPAGTRCIKLEGGGQGSNSWVVDDLSFIKDKNSILHWDSDTYGIRIAESNLVDIEPIAQPAARRMSPR